ncbi:hypothetical protein NBEOAGPD_0511 [Methylobacterium gregans]|uniref:Uncharacterized protein n=1 Tax=Methylobacterium gregans TaxID=374424 RepID=A0AA37HKC7_9HYPH|nr:hypothetical protein [Methylobacterium gregans]GJD77307.1 hypothetical protein NBEOAGPD_0511 [Methylobacterium gregans]
MLLYIHAGPPEGRTVVVPPSGRHLKDIGAARSAFKSRKTAEPAVATNFLHPLA